MHNGFRSRPVKSPIAVAEFNGSITDKQRRNMPAVIPYAGGTISYWWRFAGTLKILGG
jgi:hypothetical protein